MWELCQADALRRVRVYSAGRELLRSILDDAELDAGGKTAAVELTEKAESAGVDPSGKTAEEIESEISEAEE